MKSPLLLICLLFSVICAGQTPLDWSDLEGGISWRQSTAKTEPPGFLKANFSYKLIELDGQKVSLTGFLIVLEGTQPIYMLSKNPMAQCFFCGNGGPETISELTFIKKPKFVMDDLITVTGTLRLNGDDPTRCYYSIEEVEAFGL